MAGAKVQVLRGLGHLAHEENPGEVARLILAQADSLGLMPPARDSAAS